VADQFDPDAYLAKAESKQASTGFDPDAYLAKVQNKPTPSGLDVAASRAESLGHGIKDPITGGAQLLAHLLPDKAVEAGNELNNWLAKYGLTSAIPTTDAKGNPVKGAAAFDTQIKQDEAKVESDKQAAGRQGTDWYRLAGNVISPANLAIASRAPAAASLAGRVGTGIAQGVATSALAPVTGEGDYTKEKAKQIAAGAATGGLLPAVTGAAARVIKPLTSEAVQTLAKKGVTMTPGQILGGWAGRVEEGLTSIGGVGDAIKSAQGRGVKSFNTAAVNDALKPIGETLPKGIEGKEAVAYARETLGQKYDDLLPKLKGDLNTKMAAGVTFKDQVNNIQKLAKASPELSAQEKRILQKTIDDEIKGKFTSSGLASGATLKNIQEVLRAKAETYQISQKPSERILAGAFKELGSSTRKMIDAANPEYAGDLSKINQGYAAFKRAQRASSSVATQDGFFTPAQYQNAVKALDKTKDKRAFSEGTALGQELGSAGKSVLSQKIPDSGTAGRTWLQSPGKAAMGLLMGIPAEAAYSSIGQQVAKAALMSRPQGAAALAQLIKNSNPALTAGAVPLSQLMMSSQSK
jgi:hypothetical protein